MAMTRKVKGKHAAEEPNECRKMALRITTQSNHKEAGGQYMSANASSEGPGLDNSNGEVEKTEGKTKEKEKEKVSKGLVVHQALNAELADPRKSEPYMPSTAVSTRYATARYGIQPYQVQPLICTFLGQRYGTGPVQLRLYGRNATDFIEALSIAPKGPSCAMDLTEPGWHVSANPDTAMQIPTHPSSDTSFITALASLHGKGQKARAWGFMDSEMEDVLTTLGPQTYFYGNVQCTLWQLGDYGVAADTWQLFNHGQKSEALQEQELWVLRTEATVRLECQKYETAKTELTWRQHRVQECLHAAHVVEQMRPYLRRDPTLKELHIRPAQS
ncbi:hypothetical protein BC826DRAFT_973999 [Russula brevipes]|nr:hypothetical protein BC826DRAFT_973999 [Russula brevipes]